MGMEEDSEKKESKHSIENAILDKVGLVISAIKDAKHVDSIACALHSLAVMLFPLDSSLFLGSIDERYREQVLTAKVPCVHERGHLWHVFYKGAAFPTLARVLLYDVASNWLACFPVSLKKHVYDIFFIQGLTSEVVQALIPCLQPKGSDRFDVDVASSNAERLLVLCLLENKGVLLMAREYGSKTHKTEDFSSQSLKAAICRMAQLVASIPDKARQGAPPALTSHFFFKHVVMQLLEGAEERETILCDKSTELHESDMDRTFQFVGEVFARICRRGSADVLLHELIPRIINRVRSVLRANNDLLVADEMKAMFGSQFWMKMMEAIKDPYTIEKLSEQLLHQLAAANISDVEAYWIMWILFHQVFNHQTSVRSMFVDKFLVWKVFPVRCLRWILQFAVLECAPSTDLLIQDRKTNANGLLDVVQRLVAVWAKEGFVQSSPIEQQAYITAALGLSLEKMSKDELESTKDVMHSILQGVSCRLESPTYLVRRMAASIAFVFSNIVDPKNPLYLDDNFIEETVDWEFGLVTLSTTSNCKEKVTSETKASSSTSMSKDVTDSEGRGTNMKPKSKKLSEFKLVDPDEIIDIATLNVDGGDDNDDDNASDSSETSSDSSLQPYDLSDDDKDLKRRFSQLVDVVGALRKPEDADGVEMAIDIAEKLIRASPDELPQITSDLVRTLVQVRCSDITIEGEEESAEGKRQQALVALVATCPFESLDTLSKLLFSPNVDISQRILILDIMTDGALELSETKSMRLTHHQRKLISETSDAQAWFIPSRLVPSGAGSWKEISEPGTSLNYLYRYERELPLKPGMIKRGKTRRWSLRSENLRENRSDWSQNKFPVYAAAFMLPLMEGFDKKRHGIDMLGRDFIVLGKLIYTLGICMKCAALHPEAYTLAPPLLDMLSSREICHHKEAYVRRAVLYAASCILVALHPSYVSASLIEGKHEISEGLEWIRKWAVHVAESDTDRECYTMAVTCLQLHAEMALQASRAVESGESTFKTKTVGLPSNLLKGKIKIPFSKLEY